MGSERPSAGGRKVRRRLGVPFLMVLFAFMLLSAPFPLTGAAEEQWQSSELPYTLRDATATSDGKFAYIFGGYSLRNGTEGLITDTILRFDPRTGAASELGVRLPFPLLQPDSFWDGSRAFIYGGTGYEGTPLNYLIIFTPPDKLEVRNGFFPYGLKGTSTVWTGREAYLFGNCVCTAEAGQKNVLRLDPEKMDVEVLNGSLPHDLAGTSAVWTGKAAFLFGGNTVRGASDAILRFDPASGTCGPVKAVLPFPRFKTGAVLSGGNALVFGGRHSGGFTDEVLVYDPASDNLTLSERRLPAPSACRASCLVGTKLHLFGGEKAGEPLDRTWTLTVESSYRGQAGPGASPFRDLVLGAVYIAIAATVVMGVFAHRRYRVK